MLQDCEDATKRDPKEFAAWFDKGNILVRLGLFKDALNSYTTAADLAPGISGKPPALKCRAIDPKRSMYCSDLVDKRRVHADTWVGVVCSRMFECSY